MENFSGDGIEGCEQFGDWSTCSSEHWNEAHTDSTGFGDWTTFKEDVGEENNSAKLPSQEGQILSRVYKVETADEPLTVIQDCFHDEDVMKDIDMTNVLPLSQLLCNCTRTSSAPEVLLRRGARFYHSLLCEPKPLSIMGPKPNFHSHKQLTDTLQLKQNTDLPHPEFEKLEISSAALIRTKLTAPTWCQNSPGFLYQISHQWIHQYSSRLQNHQDNKDLL